MVPVGGVGLRYFQDRDVEIPASFVDLGEDIDVFQSRDIANYVRDAFVRGRADEVYVCYTRFESAMSQEVVVERLLPITSVMAGDESEDEEVSAEEEYFFEPSALELFSDLLPKFLENRVYQMLMEAKTSEHAMRMMAMKNATDNAEEFIEELTLEYNRARQSAITREIADIMGGSEAISRE